MGNYSEEPAVPVDAAVRAAIAAGEAIMEVYAAPESDWEDRKSVV